MAPLSPKPRSRLQALAFTMIELILFVTVFVLVSSIGFRSMFALLQQRKLRTAAVELSGYLQVARNVALTENSLCTIAMTNQTEGVFGPDTSVSGNSCKDGTIQSSVNLRNFSGSRNLRVEPLPNAGTYPITFTPEGTLVEGATVLIRSTDVVEGSWCVDVQAPLATVRIGWLPANSNRCDYSIEQ